MARKKSKAKPSFMIFNVTYEDGTLSSNRKVSTEHLDQRFGDDIEDLALAALTGQDEEIARHSGFRRPKIKSIARV